MLTPRWSRDCRKCTFHLQEDPPKWIARDCAHFLLIILPLGLYGRSHGLRQGVQLVRQHDGRRRSPDLVRHLLDVHPLLRWHESSRDQPQDPAIRVSPPALCGMVCCDQLSCYMLGACVGNHSILSLMLTKVKRPRLSYTVQRLVGLPPWELDYGRLCHKLPAPCDVPDIVRCRKVLEANSNCPSVRDGFLHWTCRDRGRNLR